MANVASNTGSILTGPGGRDRTGLALSTFITIKVNNVSVGAVQNLSVREERTAQVFAEVGQSGALDSAPTSIAKFSGTMARIRFDRLRATEALGRGFLHVQSQRIPFDIVVLDRWAGDNASAIVTTVENVWITGIDYQYQADNWIITDNVSWIAENMYSTINGAQNAATGGERGPSIMEISDIERQTDRGQRRGSLDVGGLINDFFSNA